MACPHCDGTEPLTAQEQALLAYQAAIEDGDYLFYVLSEYCQGRMPLGYNAWLSHLPKDKLGRVSTITYQQPIYSFE